MQAGGIKETANLRGLDFAAAIEAHRKWKTRLTEYINGNSTERLDHHVICQDNQCALGKWIYGEGMTFVSHIPVFHDMKASHALFHIQAGRIVELVKDDEKEKALDLLDKGQFSFHSNKVQTQLAKLFVEIHGK
jgi:Chemoreceptor zinc-binding domain